MKSKHYYIPNKANNEKHTASLLELFFDLVLVAFVGSFVHRMIHMVEHGTLNWFSVSFVMLTLVTVLFIWKQFTVYSSRYENMYNYRHRILTLIIMLGIGIISAALYLDFGHDLDNLNKIVIVTVPGYFLTIVPLIYMHLTVGYMAENKYEKKRQYISAMGAIISGMLATIGSVSSILYNTTTSQLITIVFWISTIVVWILFGILSTSMKISINTRDTSLEHLQERFGIIFIVFIGETIVQTISATSQILLSDTAESVIKLVAIMGIMFSWWWWFNDTINYPDIINHPRRIASYKLSLIFILVALSITAVGFSGTISHPSETVWKYFLAAGMMIWAISNAVLFISLKDYKLKDKVMFPRFLRIAIYTLPLWNTPLLSLFFVDQITTTTFLYMTLGGSMLLIILSISLTAVRRRMLENKKFDFEKFIKDYEKQEDEWIRKSAYKYIDKEIHAQYDNDLNHYSKYIK